MPDDAIVLLTELVHHLIRDEEDAYQVGYEAGVRDERYRLAVAQYELAATWKPVARVGYEQRIAERVRRTDGRPDWPGLEQGGVLPSAVWTVPDQRRAA